MTHEKHWCPNGEKIRPWSSFLCSLCMGEGAIDLPTDYKENKNEQKDENKNPIFIK